MVLRPSIIIRSIKHLFQVALLTGGQEDGLDGIRLVGVSSPPSFATISPSDRPSCSTIIPCGRLAVTIYFSIPRLTFPITFFSSFLVTSFSFEGATNLWIGLHPGHHGGYDITTNKVNLKFQWMKSRIMTSHVNGRQ